MLARVIFFTAVSAAILVVILLALLPPPSHKIQPRPWLALSLYVHPPHHHAARWRPSRRPNGAFVFRHVLTDGPTNTSRVIGRAQGFAVPTDRAGAAHSVFNIVHLAFDTPEYSGSLSVEACSRGSREELAVVGGTGVFAFARGFASFARTETMEHLQLRLEFPGRSSAGSNPE